MKKENKALEAKLKGVKKMIYALDRSEIETGSQIEKVAIDKLEDGHTAEYVAFHHHITMIIGTIQHFSIGNLTNGEEQDLLDNVYEILETNAEENGWSDIYNTPTFVIMQIVFIILNGIKENRRIACN